MSELYWNWRFHRNFWWQKNQWRNHFEWEGPPGSLPMVPVSSLSLLGEMVSGDGSVKELAWTSLREPAVRVLRDEWADWCYSTSLKSAMVFTPLKLANATCQSFLPFFFFGFAFWKVIIKHLEHISEYQYCSLSALVPREWSWGARQGLGVVQPQWGFMLWGWICCRIPL